MAPSHEKVLTADLASAPWSQVASLPEGTGRECVFALDVAGYVDFATLRKAA